MEKQITLDFERETKRTYRFSESAPPEQQTIGTLYVQKSTFQGKRPDRITVTIAWD